MKHYGQVAVSTYHVALRREKTGSLLHIRIKATNRTIATQTAIASFPGWTFLTIA